ncbi:alcohol dehydrogenase, partial [bacterium]|nr:alcohol dehydrogenase [bacterium]
MRSVAAIDGQGEFHVIQEPVPEPAAGEVQVQVKASLISPGTELGGIIARRADPTDDGPKPFGYQNAGIVTQVGEGVERFHVGERVACMGGGYAQHASHSVCPVNLTVPIPDGVSFEEAAFCHLAATSLHAVRRVAPGFGEYVGVSGLGLVGQLAVAFAHLSGCHVVGLDRLGMRLDVAKSMGADAVFDVTQDD